MGCHAQILPDSPLLAPVRASYANDTPLRWRKVTKLPDFVFFDHAIHVERGVGCESCHGRVDQMALVAPAVRIHMGWCLDCHRDPTPHLREPADATVMGMAPSRRRGRAVAARLAIRPPTHCTGCHR